MNPTCLVVIGDGRKNYLAQTMASLDYLWLADIAWRILVDDTGDPDYHRYLADTYPHYALHCHPERRGMAAAVATGMNAALRTDAPRTLWWEEDFELPAPIDVGAMDTLLSSQVHLAQLTLKRQPWNAEEIAAGDILATAPDDYAEHQVAEGWYCEHQRLFSFNPSLMPRRVLECAVANPGDGLERGVTDALLAEGYRFGIYGRRDDRPLVNHIGVERSAGYRW